MSKKVNDIITVLLFSGFIFLSFLICILKPETTHSESERRELAKMPDFTIETVLSGNFSENFEKYASDQIPFRDTLRSLKAYFVTDVLFSLENNGLYEMNGHISKLDEKENLKMIDHATQKFRFIYDNYLKNKNTKVFFTLIPDKNYYLAYKSGYPSIDYDSFIKKCIQRTGYMKYIDITKLLSSDDFYKTDTHWKQECITDVAEKITETMGKEFFDNYTKQEIETPFYGVYAKQWSKKIKGDKLSYLTNKIIENCNVVYYDNKGKPYSGSIYDMDKVLGKDPYEMFLSGTNALIEIENPKAKNTNKLIIFRDSFSSSLAPLLAGSYHRTILIDIRYIKSDALKYFVDFENSDVLFAYSTSLINSSMSLN